MKVGVSNKTATGDFLAGAGVSDWRVADYIEAGDLEDEDQDEEVKLRWHDTFEDAKECKMQNAVPSLWPKADNAKYNLQHCNRFLPHDQDTGGFFVALLRMNQKLPSEGIKVGSKRGKEKGNSL